ncbi:Ctr copper transporter [Lactifluus volemus]|nr:Ctr copper transporter [Lactifluus volemus]
MDQGMAMNMGNMIAYLHFTIGDNLWFLGWAPRSTGAMVGTCIGLFILAIAERWLAMMRGVMEAHWNTRLDLRICLSCSAHAQVMQCSDSLANNFNNSSVASSPKKRKTSSSQAAQPRCDSQRRTTPPFVLTYDIPRGIIQAVLASVNILFMLTVMTFQIGFIIAVVIGLGVGEALFGRYNPYFVHSH